VLNQYSVYFVHRLFEFLIDILYFFDPSTWDRLQTSCYNFR